MARENLERLPQIVTVVAINVLGLLAAVWCGSHAGTGDTRSVLMFFGGVFTLLFIFKARTAIWLLIPIVGPVGYALAFLPGGLPLKDVAIVLVFGSFLSFKALKIIRNKPVYGWLDFVLLLNLLYLLSVFIRNPVGTEGMGLARVGGRGYVETIFGLMAYWIYQHVRITPSIARKLPYLLSIGDFVNGIMAAIIAHFPSAGLVLGYFFKGMDASKLEAHEEDIAAARSGIGLSREQYLAGVGGALYKLLCTIFSPMTLVNPLYIVRFCLFLLSLYTGLISGHRSTLPFFAVMFCLSLYFRGRGSDVLKVSFFVIPTLAVVIALQGNFVQFPINIQRALCVLPGKWNPAAVEDARQSSEWRFQMWERVLKSNKYIANKWFGDGFGFTRAQLMEMVNSPGDAQENFMISGDYHNGPLSAIRDVGYVGLVLLYFLLVNVVNYGWRLTKAARDTPYFTLAIFSCIPIMYSTLAFTFLAGDFKTYFPDVIASVGFLRMFSESLAEYKAQLALDAIEVKVPVASGNAPVSIGRGAGQPA